MSQGGVIQSARDRCLDRAQVHGGGPTWVRAKLMAGVTLAGVDLDPVSAGSGQAGCGAVQAGRV